MSDVRTGASGEAVRDTPAQADDFGSVVRVVGPVVIIPAPGHLQPGAETVVGAAAVSILAGNPLRTGAILQNTGLAPFRFGVAGVTATTGARLLPNATVVLSLPDVIIDEIFAIREGNFDSVAFAAEVL